MTPRKLTALLASLFLLASPATALAQSAGDEQYVDPIEEPAPPSDGGGETPSGSGTAPSAPSAPAAPAAPTEPGTTATPTAAGELPRTGMDAVLIALAGCALLLAGLGVRLALPRRP